MDYKGAYLTLSDAVLSVMADGDKENWDSTEHLPEESRLELLVEYVQHIMCPPRTMDSDAIAQHEIMISYERAGFSHDDSFELLKLIIVSGFQAHMMRGGGD